MRPTAAIVLLLLPLLAGCKARVYGLPRVEVEASSPDGRYVAQVRNHPSIDPPRQTLWLREEGGRWVRLARLGEDTHWCNAVGWSADSGRVAFLVQDASVMVYEARSGRLVDSIWLVGDDRGYPTTYRSVRRFQLGPSGDSLRFTVCDRRRGTDCEESVVPVVPEQRDG